jgi:hypothetical protein|tara:strand:+ start:6633 stop:7154 length:522 start_codon:yes stop_codon:yes gene_type:complete
MKTLYEWICEPCSIFWDRECKLGKAPQKTKCPKCKKLSERYWRNSGIGISFKDDGAGNSSNPGANDFHTIKRRYQKHAEEGYDKQSGDRFLRREIKKAKEAMDDESFRYKSATINYEKLAEDGKVRKLSDKEASEKVERSKKLTMDAYDKANKMGYKDIGSETLDISKPQKQQ